MKTRPEFDHQKSVKERVNVVTKPAVGRMQPALSVQALGMDCVPESPSLDGVVAMNASLAANEALEGRSESDIAKRTRTVTIWPVRYLVAAVQAGDAFAILIASIIPLYVARTSTGVTAATVGTTLIASGSAALVFHLVLRSFGAYLPANLERASTSGARAAMAWLMVSGSMLLSAEVAGLNIGELRGWITAWCIAAVAMVLCLRLALASGSAALRRLGRFGNTVCIVGTGDEARTCAAHVKGDGSVLLGHFSANQDSGKRPREMPYLGELKRLPTYLLRNRVDEIVVAPSYYERQAMEEAISFLCCLPVNLTIWSESIGCSTHWLESNCKTGGTTLLPIYKAPLNGWPWLLKDVHDRLIALMALLLSLPVMAVISIGIKLSSPGPVFFRQIREGYNGREFRIFKFRTMHNADTAPSDRLELATKADQRVFPLGRLLRQSSLDELPQLLNVLAGNMWLVGPRPHSPLATAAGRRYTDLVTHYRARHRIKPGITGWAQVNGWRGPTCSEEQIQQRVAHDLHYIANWSIWFDWRIILMTATRGFIHENAF